MDFFTICATTMDGWMVEWFHHKSLHDQGSINTRGLKTMRGSITIEGCIATGGSVFIESYFTRSRRGHNFITWWLSIILFHCRWCTWIFSNFILFLCIHDRVNKYDVNEARFIQSYCLSLHCHMNITFTHNSKLISEIFYWWLTIMAGFHLYWMYCHL